jgi:META domain
MFDKDVDGRDKPGHDGMRAEMKSAITVLRQAGAALVLVTALQVAPARADDEFPFGLEMTLDVARQPGSKRLPTLEIGDNGEVILELWCKGGKGQFSVAGNTVIFVAGPLEDRACPPARAQADDELVAGLSEAATWKRQGDLVSFMGTKPLRFRINTN